jgi:hypothetical protein
MRLHIGGLMFVIVFSQYLAVDVIINGKSVEVEGKRKGQSLFCKTVDKISKRFTDKTKDTNIHQKPVRVPISK